MGRDLGDAVSRDADGCTHSAEKVEIVSMTDGLSYAICAGCGEELAGEIMTVESLIALVDTARECSVESRFGWRCTLRDAHRGPHEAWHSRNLDYTWANEESARPTG